MMMALWLALAVVTPSASATYVVKKLFAANDATCNGTASVTQTMGFKSLSGRMFALAGAPAGTTCWPLDKSKPNQFMKLTTSAGACTMWLHADKACANTSSNASVFAGKCEKTTEDGKVFHEMMTCGTVMVGADLTCLKLDADALKTAENSKKDPCGSTCDLSPTTCDSLTKAFTGCSKTCTAKVKEQMRSAFIFASSNTIDCKCTAGNPPSTASSNYHAIPQLAMLVVATILAAA